MAPTHPAGPPGTSDAVEQHRSYAPRGVGCFVLTASDSRTPGTDRGGDRIAAQLEAAGHRITGRGMVREDASALRAAVTAALDRSDVAVLLITGGTGLAPRDRTPDVVAPLLERHLDGFGELFRWLSFEEIGPPAMLSRALAGTVGESVVFVMPGSPAAVDLALQRLILPELGHLVGQLRRGKREP